MVGDVGQMRMQLMLMVLQLSSCDEMWSRLSWWIEWWLARACDVVQIQCLTLCARTKDRQTEQRQLVDCYSPLSSVMSKLWWAWHYEVRRGISNVGAA